MTPWHTFRTALIGLAGHKLRAALTSLGVIIGVASVMATLALGEGARAAVEQSFRSLGSDEIQIAPKKAIEDGELVPYGSPLTYEDGLLMAAGVELVDRVEMSVSGEAKVRHGRTAVEMTATGMTGDALKSVIARGEVQPVGWPDGQSLTPEAFLAGGRVPTASEVLADAEVCVLGSQTSLDLFEGDDPIGGVIWINRHRCLVIGVLVELEATDPEARYQTKANEGIYMPIGTAIRALFDEEPSVQIMAHVMDESRMGEAKMQVASYLRARHGLSSPSEPSEDLGRPAGSQPHEGTGKPGTDGRDDFSLTTKQDLVGAQQEAARTFSTLLIALAVVSLAVGGIGIMNVLLVSVSERTREIGIRLAVGAQRRDLVLQFLLEALLLGAAGGCLGVVAGVLAIPLASAVSQGAALLDPTSIPLALGVSLLTGLIFGLYPAVRASRLDPIQALRYE